MNREKEIRKLFNEGSLNLPSEALRKALPCDGCGRMPVINPLWLTKNNDWFLPPKKYILGCPTAMWGCATGYETLIEAIDNWNYHVEKGGHHCEPR